MPVVKRENFGTDRVPDWIAIRGGINAMGCSTREQGQTVESHFHDAEEFWFVLRGRARVMAHGEEHVVEPGDVVCMHMGEDHALLEVIEAPYTQVWVECNLRGKRRMGHLHRDKDEPS